jgi:hypothetical protein
MTTRSRGGAPVDRVPELTHYQDEGCRVWPSCLSCPLPRCIYDDPRQGRGARTRLRDADIARLSAEGWTANALAAHYKVSRRQIFRILRHERRAARADARGKQPRG